jgi:hypothetical protein
VSQVPAIRSDFDAAIATAPPHDHFTATVVAVAVQDHETTEPLAFNVDKIALRFPPLCGISLPDNFLLETTAGLSVAAPQVPSANPQFFSAITTAQPCNVLVLAGTTVAMQDREPTELAASEIDQPAHGYSPPIGN